MRVWVQSPGSSNIRVCEFRLEFLSYKKKKKKLAMLTILFYKILLKKKNFTLQDNSIFFILNRKYIKKQTLVYDPIIYFFNGIMGFEIYRAHSMTIILGKIIF
jgi:hypothetical protein